jgi:hypothetical protein
MSIANTVRQGGAWLCLGASLLFTLLSAIGLVGAGASLADRMFDPVVYLVGPTLLVRALAFAALSGMSAVALFALGRALRD